VFERICRAEGTTKSNNQGDKDNLSGHFGTSQFILILYTSLGDDASKKLKLR
jgi:hypothetical protein